MLKDQFLQQKTTHSQPDFSNYSWPQIDWTDAVQFKDRTTQLENLLTELRKLSRREMMFLLNSIFDLPRLND